MDVEVRMYSGSENNRYTALRSSTKKSDAILIINELAR
jgi:hypothetical protein